MDKKQISGGLILAYALIIINTLYGLFVTPFVLSQIGTMDFGVYRTIASFSASLVVVDLGIGSTVMRYISFFRATNDKKKIQNYLAMILMQAVVIVIALVAISCFCYILLPQIFGGKFSIDQLDIAQKLFIVLIINMGLSVFENVFFGIITGSNKFIVGNTIKMFRIVLKMILVFALLTSFQSSLTLVMIDTTIVILAIIIEIIYVIFKLKIIPRFYFFDKLLFFESFNYSILLLVQTIVIQFNGNIDNIIIAAYIGAGAVAIYSIGLQLFNMFEQFAMAFSDLMLPTVTKQIVNNDSNTQLENTVIKTGRFQFIFLGAVLCGFFVLGQEFITMWVGTEFLDAWSIGLILMIPATIPLIQNVCLSILRAKRKLGFKTMMVSITAVLNLIITYVGVSLTGNYFWAAIGTAVSLTITNLISMNIYYYRVLGINIFRIFKNIFSRTWICLIIPTVCIYLIKGLFKFNIGSLIIQILAFVIIYGVLLVLFGLNNDEKTMLKKVIKR